MGRGRRAQCGTIMMLDCKARQTAQQDSMHTWRGAAYRAAWQDVSTLTALMPHVRCTCPLIANESRMHEDKHQNKPGAIQILGSVDRA